MGVPAATVGRLALSLPAVAQSPHHDIISFRVAGKISATVPAGGDRVHVFLDADEVAAYRAEFPGTVEELWWGKKLRRCKVVLAQATTPLLRELLQDSWRRRAPKKVLAAFDD